VPQRCRRERITESRDARYACAQTGNIFSVRFCRASISCLWSSYSSGVCTRYTPRL